MLSRRNFLKLIGMMGATLPLMPLRAQIYDDDIRDFEEAIFAILGDQPFGLDLRRIDPETGRVDVRVINNAYTLYPIASCFKMLVVLYYLTVTPRERWQVDEDSAAYRVAVFSNNPMTGDLIAEAAAYYPLSGNAIERFNHFIRNTLLMQNGIHDWDWPGSPTIGESDPLYAASPSRSVIGRDGTAYAMDNVFYAADLAEAWARLLSNDPMPGEPQAVEAIEMVFELFSIPAEDYEAPIERAWGDYIGKDGVIPDADSPIGRVVNDAGIIRVGEAQTPYVVAAMFAGSEFRFVESLRAILEATEAYEQLRTG
jgi:hypothetical protein